MTSRPTQRVDGVTSRASTTIWTGHSFTDRHLPRAPDHQLTTHWKTLQVLDGSNQKHVVSISLKPNFDLLCSVRRFNSWLYNCIIISKGQFNIQDTSKRICRPCFPDAKPLQSIPIFIGRVSGGRECICSQEPQPSRNMSCPTHRRNYRPCCKLPHWFYLEFRKRISWVISNGVGFNTIVIHRQGSAKA